MMNEFLANKIHRKIKNLPANQNFVVVLKGIPLDAVDENFFANLDAATKNPFRYFGKIIDSGRRFVSYEEFLLLSADFLGEFDAVYILNNNLYVNQFPVDANFSESTRKNLLSHFSEVADENSKFPDEINLGRMAEIFNGVKERDELLICAYNDAEILASAPIETLNIFEPVAEEIATTAAENLQNCVDVQEESDFVWLVHKVIFDAPEEIFVRLHNSGNREILSRHIQMLQANFSAQTKIYRVHSKNFQPAFKSRPEYLKILKRYWGVDSFRNFEIYDLQKLLRDIKTTRQISQEQIIANIVEQAEACENNGLCKDIFVTAPTGAGKSLIFQIPAIYLAEKYNLLTIVISPLIGLMNDQVKNLEIRNYPCSRTINSDIAPIIKEEIIAEVARGKCHILYVAPETLLSRSDLEQLIGERTVGMIVIDEAHIVTTWGKQFRPDYWYLGDYIQRARKAQIEKKGRSFVIATFTATAIYGGLEDMYNTTIQSLNMFVDEQTTYLGYVKRGDIDIKIKPYQKAGERAEHSIDKFNVIQSAVDAANSAAKKTLIYFPEVKLIQKAEQELENAGRSVAVYYGPLEKFRKKESYEKFLSGELYTMLATKAFGMGIDIDDIEIVMHFAPTGSVCDYVQEIGRAARKSGLQGTALYFYSKNDFKHINRLHGLSTIKNYQLLKVVEKIYHIYQKKRRSDLLLDAQNFAYIFDSSDKESETLSRVKMSLLMLQRDFEFKYGFSPITMRPVPLYSEGLFQIGTMEQIFLQSSYSNCLEEIDAEQDIFQVNLKTIWERDFRKYKYTFPSFKYHLYTDSRKLMPFELKPVLSVSVEKNLAPHKDLWKIFKSIIENCVWRGNYFTADALAEIFEKNYAVPKYRAQEICDVLIASMRIYNESFRGDKVSSIFALTTRRNGDSGYRFNSSVNFYFKWVDATFREIKSELQGGHFYLINTPDEKLRVKACTIVLGIFEALDEISFDMVGGSNSQIYIHINQIRNLNYILNHRDAYKNEILEEVRNRHLISVEMLTYLYENNFGSAQIWDLLEDYFLGKIPDEVKAACLEKNPRLQFS